MTSGGINFWESIDHSASRVRLNLGPSHNLEGLCPPPGNSVESPLARGRQRNGIWLPVYSGNLLANVASQKAASEQRSPMLHSVLFFSRPRSEGWPHHARTFSIYPCPLSFWLTLPRRVLSTSWCCKSRPCVAFLACVHLALFLALSLSPGSSLVSSRCDNSFLALTLSSSSLFTPALLRTHSFVFFACYITYTYHNWNCSTPEDNHGGVGFCSVKWKHLIVVVVIIYDVHMPIPLLQYE